MTRCIRGLKGNRSEQHSWLSQELPQGFNLWGTFHRENPNHHQEQPPNEHDIDPLPAHCSTRPYRTHQSGVSPIQHTKPNTVTATPIQNPMTIGRTCEDKDRDFMSHPLVEADLVVPHLLTQTQPLLRTHHTATFTYSLCGLRHSTLLGFLTMRQADWTSTAF